MARNGLYTNYICHNICSYNTVLYIIISRNQYGMNLYLIRRINNRRGDNYV